MKNATTPTPSLRQDRGLLRRTLWSLTAVHKAVCVSVIAVVALAWFSVLERVLAFGRTVDYSGLSALGGHAITLLQQYNPFFWWAVVVLCTLIIAYFLKLFVQASRRRVMARVVGYTVVQQLAQSLSPAGLDVLNWSWVNRREPLRVGDINRCLDELNAGRAQRIELARQHQELLGARTDTNT
jgi:hypothetical protein